MQCHIEETVDLLQDMGFDGHFIVVFWTRFLLNLKDFCSCALEPFADLKPVSMTFSRPDFMFDFSFTTRDRRLFRLLPNP
jgi:hypothetical protein